MRLRVWRAYYDLGLTLRKPLNPRPVGLKPYRLPILDSVRPATGPCDGPFQSTAGCPVCGPSQNDLGPNHWHCAHGSRYGILEYSLLKKFCMVHGCFMAYASVSLRVSLRLLPLLLPLLGPRGETLEVPLEDVACSRGVDNSSWRLTRFLCVSDSTNFCGGPFVIGSEAAAAPTTGRGSDFRTGLDSRARPWLRPAPAAVEGYGSEYFGEALEQGSPACAADGRWRVCALAARFTTGGGLSNLTPLCPRSFSSVCRSSSLLFWECTPTALITSNRSALTVWSSSFAAGAAAAEGFGCAASRRSAAPSLVIPRR